MLSIDDLIYLCFYPASQFHSAHVWETPAMTNGVKRNSKKAQKATDRKAIAARLKAARINAKYRTATGAAHKLEIPTPSYLSYENGTRSLPTRIAQICANAYGTTIQQILTGDHTGKSLPISANAKRAQTSDIEKLSEQLGTLTPSMRAVFFAHLTGMILVLRSM